MFIYELKTYLLLKMMRQIVPYLMIALVCAAFLPASCATGVADSKELTKIISQGCVTHMTTNDLAFFLATHNYDATPKNGYVQVKVDGMIYKVVVGDENSGLANI